MDFAKLGVAVAAAVALAGVAYTRTRNTILLGGKRYKKTGRAEVDGVSEAVPSCDDVKFPRNVRAELFQTERFDHVEFIAGDAVSIAKRFAAGLGMSIVAKSDMSTGNHNYSSFVLRTNEITFVVTAPYGADSYKLRKDSKSPHPNHSNAGLHEFFSKHGLAACAVGVRVADAVDAFRKATANGGIPVLAPTTLTDANGKKLIMAEVHIYGDVVLRFLSTPKDGTGYEGAFLPNYADCPLEYPNFGLRRLDHCVGNVPHIAEVQRYICAMTGWHMFACFNDHDVGTPDSGLNSVVLSSDNEMVLLPLNEPTHGTNKISQIQVYLDQNGGAGVQHMALKCDDIFRTMSEMKKAEGVGFEFMPPPPAKYYEDMGARIGEGLSAAEIRRCAELGILVDRDAEGILLQIFTKPLGDRATFFFEIIERRCFRKLKGAAAAPAAAPVSVVYPELQAAGCGGFGKGNFSALFKSIERDFDERNIAGSAKAK